MLLAFCEQQLQRGAVAANWARPRRCSRCYASNRRTLLGKLPVVISASEASSEPALPSATVITSVNNPYIKHCVKLRQRARYRNGLRRVLLCGSVLLNELAAQTALNVRVLFIPCGSALSALQLDAAKVIEVNEAVFSKLSGLETSTGVDAIAEVELPATTWTDTGKQLRRVLALDGVQDPGNMGTLLRTARAFSWDAAWLLPGCCDPFNDKALRASRGAALTLPLSHGSWGQLLQVAEDHHLQLLAAEPEQQGDPQASSSQQPLANGAVLVLGSEGRGLSVEALQHCRAVAIPMPGTMESLNVSVAGGILMFALSDGLQTLTKKLDAIGVGNVASVPGQ